MQRRSSKKWRDANLERARENYRKWAKANRAHLREYERAKYQREEASPVRNEKRAKLATKSPTIVDLAWAAGFMEGEGWFGLNSRKAGIARSQVASIHQKQREPLDRIMAIFGGTLTSRATDPRWPDNIYWAWRCSGIRARGVMMTMYPFMSPRRKEQIRNALKGLAQCKPAA